MAENNSSAPLKTAGEPFVALGECMADQICQRVAELPDRDSPADWPEAKLVTPDELRNIILDAINDAAQAVAAQAAPAAVAVPEFDEWITREYPHLGPIGDGVNIAHEAWNAGRAAMAAAQEGGKA